MGSTAWHWCRGYVARSGAGSVAVADVLGIGKSRWSGRVLTLLVGALVIASCTGTTGPSPARSRRAVAGFTLVASGVRLGTECRAAARYLAIPVPCPELLPKALKGESPSCATVAGLPPCVFPTAYPARRSWYGFVLSWTAFSVPPGYTGVPGPYPSGHLVIGAERVGQQASFGCADGRVVGKSSENALAVTWINCPIHSRDEEVSGHLVARWDMRGIAYEASLHGWNRVNHEVLRRIIRSIRFVGA